MSSLQAHNFDLVLSKFKSSLAPEELPAFEFTTLPELYTEMRTIERKHASERRLKAMKRLDKFLEGMQDYDKTIQVFVNSSAYVGFVWVSFDDY